MFSTVAQLGLDGFFLFSLDFCLELGDDLGLVILFLASEHLFASEFVRYLFVTHDAELFDLSRLFHLLEFVLLLVILDSIINHDLLPLNIIHLILPSLVFLHPDLFHHATHHIGLSTPLDVRIHHGVVFGDGAPRVLADFHRQ